MATKRKTTKSTKAKRQNESFWTWRWSVETVYWLILLLLVLAMGVWIMQLTMQTHDIYDRIDSIQSSEMIQPKDKS